MECKGGFDKKWQVVLRIKGGYAIRDVLPRNVASFPPQGYYRIRLGARS